MVQKVQRAEAEEIKKLRGWLLIYGRRKIGKTFLIKNFLNFDYYFIIRRDGKIMAEKFPVSEFPQVEQFLGVVKESLGQGKTIVIDEFQRLPPYFYDEIARFHPGGRLLLSGSSMRVVKKIFTENSPLLGLLLQYKLDLISPANIIYELGKENSAEKAVEIGSYVKDPWLIPFIDLNNFLGSLFTTIIYSDFTIPALVGEIFSEEERELTKTYEAILRLLGSGEWNYKNIASILTNRGIISRADSALVIPYLRNLENMGLVEKLPIFNSPKKMYRLLSPPMELFYYLDDRYTIRERKLSFDEAKPTLEKLRNLAVQNFLGDLFAQLYEGRKEYFVSPEREIDFIITKRNKPVVVCEVKWGSYTKNDLEKFKERTKQFSQTRRIFLAKSKKAISSGVEVITPKEVLSEVKKFYKK